VVKFDEDNLCVGVWKMYILAMDTSNKPMSVAVCKDEEILGEVTLNVKKNHSVSLLPTIDFLLAHVGLVTKDIERVVVSAGPGSYTGIRIAVTTAKMLAFTLNCELVGVSSLAAIAANFPNEEALIVPLVDARRGNVFTGFYRFENGKLVNVAPDCHASMKKVIDAVKDEKNVLFVGEVANFKELIEEEMPSARVNTHSRLNLVSAVEIANIGRTKTPVENIDDFVPNYLKRVEAEEKWLEKIGHPEGLDKERENYVEKI
jgi:tRNA threonylcarbamoyl adenosine modification protein YeaZ